jgi:hypothetical protein
MLNVTILLTTPFLNVVPILPALEPLATIVTLLLEEPNVNPAKLVNIVTQ